MNRTKPPAFPVVHVTMRPDGSAQVNLAGEHHVFTGTSTEESREQVIAYAIAHASALGRGVRMRLVDEDGTFELAVYPDGAVQRLEQPNSSRRRRSTAVTAPPVAAAPLLAPLPLEQHTPEPTGPRPEPIEDPPTVLVRPRLAAAPPEPVAALELSTGETHEIRGRVVIGRRGTNVTAPEGWARVDLDDPSGAVSRSHASLQFNDGELWITDLGSTNGTIVHRGHQQLIVDATPTQLHTGDAIVLGEDLTAHVSIQLAAEVKQ